MSDENQQQAENQGGQVVLLTQYVKDLSFESPNTPAIFQAPDADQKPRIDVNVSVRVNQVGPEGYEVVLLGHQRMHRLLPHQLRPDTSYAMSRRLPGR